MPSENASAKMVTLFSIHAYGEEYKMAAKVTIKHGNECHMFNLSYKSTTQVEQVLSVFVCSFDVGSCKFGAKMSGP